MASGTTGAASGPDAPEQSQAFARYLPSAPARGLASVGASERLAGYGLPLAVLILLAGAGASIGRRRRRSRRMAFARLSIQSHISTPSSRRRT